MTDEEQEYRARDDARAWPDDRVLRLIRQGYVSSLRRGQNESSLVRLFQYMRDDYEELLARKKELEWKQGQVFGKLLCLYVEKPSEREEWWDEWGW